MSKGNFECKECGHVATFSKKQMLDHIKSHSEWQFCENNLADKSLLLEGPAYGKEVSF